MHCMRPVESSRVESSRVDWSGLGVFRCVRKMPKSDHKFCHVYMSVRLELRSHWTDFREVLYLSIFRQSVEKIPVSLKSDKTAGTWHEDFCTFMIMSVWILLIMRNIQTKSIEIIKTLILCSLTFSKKIVQFLRKCEKKTGNVRVT